MASNFYDNSVVTRVTGTIHVDNYGRVVPVTGTVEVSPTPAKRPTTRLFAATTESIMLVDSNPARKQLWVYLTGPAYLYLGLGGVVTGSSYFLKVEPEAFWELPVGPNVYTGQIYGAFSENSGTAAVTEIW